MMDRQTRIITIIPKGLWEIVESKSILKSFVVKNLVGKYKNSLLGLSWNFVSPLLMLIVYYVAFTGIKDTTIDNYWLYLAAGIFPFHFMLNNITHGTSIFVNNARIIKKIYLPKQILIIAQIITSAIVCLIGMGCTILLMIVTKSYTDLAPLLELPLVLVLMVLFSTGITLCLSSINVYCRDIQHLIASISIVLFFLTPVHFQTSEISGLLSLIVDLNPLSYYIEAIHEIIYNGTMVDINLLLTCFTITLVVLTAGILIYNKLKHHLVERL